MRLNIQAKLQLSIIIVTVVVMSFSVWYTNSLISSTLQENYARELNLLSGSMLKTVNTTASQIKRDIVRLAAEPSALALLAYEAAGGNPGEERTRLQTLALAMVKTAVQHSIFEVVNVTRPDGLIVSGSAGTTTDKVNISKRPYFQAGLRGETYIGEPVHSMSTGHKIISISAPVKNHNGAIIGVVSADIDCRNIQNATIEGIKIGKTGYAFVFGSETGLMIAHPDYDGHVQKTRLNEYDWGRTILQQKNGIISHADPETGRIQRTVFRSDKESGWFSAVIIEEDEIHAASATVRNHSLLVMAVGVVLVCLIIFLIMRPVLASLQKTVDFSQAVAAGNLDEVLRVQRTDEIGVLADALRKMVANLKEHITSAQRESAKAMEESSRAQAAQRDAELATQQSQQKQNNILLAAKKLEDVVKILSTASAKLSSQIEQSERDASEQAARVGESAVAMEQMSNAVIEVARNASAASEASGITREKAETGSKVVLGAVQSIRQVQEDSLKLKEDMATLGQHAQSISQIMSVISDIADQTNLLALNAAIEAARAGEAGRGFAVVADEVRKLAEKTMASTTDVGNAIKAIQQSTEKSMKQVDVAVANIEKATELATESGGALKAIVDMVDSTADQVRAIATASEEQSSSSEAISMSLAEVRTIADGTAQAMEEASRAVVSLAEQAQDLSKLIEEMKNM